MKKRDLKTLLSLLLIFTLIIITQFALVYFFKRTATFYLIPALWLIISTYSYIRIRKHAKKFNPHKFIIRDYSLIGSLIFIVIFILSGLVVGFAKTPFNTSLLGIFKNSLFFILIPVIQEIARENFIRKANDKNKYYILGIVTIFFAIIDTDFYNYQKIIGSFSLFIDYLLSDFAVAFTASTLLTYLTFKDGFKSAMLFKFPIMLMYVLTPVFPKDGNLLTMVIQLIIPYLIIAKIEKLYDYRNVFKSSIINEPKSRGVVFVYYIMISFLLLFGIGVFKFHPIAILSNSMLPHFARGDIIIVEKATSKDVKIDDILVYQLDNVQVIHRIIEVIERPEGKFYVTKGDNNEAPDALLVTENQVRGKVIASIPKIGYPSIKIRELLPNNNKPVNIEGGKNE